MLLKYSVQMKDWLDVLLSPDIQRCYRQNIASGYFALKTTSLPK